MQATTLQDMLTSALDRYVRKGGNRQNGAKLLAEEIRASSAGNLPSALVYWGFATERQAERIAREIQADALLAQGKAA